MSATIPEAFSPSACRELVRAWKYQLQHEAHTARAPYLFEAELLAIDALLREEGDVFESAGTFALWIVSTLTVTPEQLVRLTSRSRVLRVVIADVQSRLK